MTTRTLTRKTAAPPTATCQLKVTLKGSKPAIWRRIHVPVDITLAKLHRVLQAAMGWEDCHLHAFHIDGEEYSDEGMPTRTKLSSLGLMEKGKFEYTYDFGDGWDHIIVLEKFEDHGVPLEHAMCVAGARACPPEDCGGIWRYQDRLASDNFDEDSDLEGHDPEAFDPLVVNLDLSRVKLR